ncbi:MAG: Eco57I restriction-modification methylase domain-containing protein, partial [Candidatus Cloacimonetes bacterium]|nr:Eco57I restriction-modification methylase domain-containing protein [Candidatus Cloacimonadota bacterium]
FRSEYSGGFDVVIGNPPYITFALGKKQEFENKEIEYYKENFPLSSVYKVSSYLIFIDKSLKLISNNGLLSFIVPNSLYTNYYYSKFREYLIDNFSICSLCNLEYEVFKDADTGGSSISIFSKYKIENTKLFLCKNEKEFQTPYSFNIKQKEFKKIPDNKFLFSDTLISLWNKSFENSISLGSKNFRFYQGIITGNNKKFLSKEKIDEKYKPIIRGRDFYKYTPLTSKTYVLFDPKQLWSNTNKEMYLVNDKLIFRQTSDHIVATYDDEQKFSLDSTHIFFDKSENFSHKYLLTIVNSKLLNFLYQIIVPEIGKVFSQVKGVNLKKLPIKEIQKQSQLPFIQKANTMLSLNKQKQEKINKFLHRLETNFEIEKFTNKMKSFYNYDFKTLLSELKKKKIKLTLSQQDEWEEYFNNYKNEIAELQQQIDKTDKEIDQMVYELYGLTNEEIEIVEN